MKAWLSFLRDFLKTVEFAQAKSLCGLCCSKSSAHFSPLPIVVVNRQSLSAPLKQRPAKMAQFGAGRFRRALQQVISPQTRAPIARKRRILAFECIPAWSPCGPLGITGHQETSNKPTPRKAVPIAVSERGKLEKLVRTETKNAETFALRLSSY